MHLLNIIFENITAYGWDGRGSESDCLLGWNTFSNSIIIMMFDNNMVAKLENCRLDYQIELSTLELNLTPFLKTSRDFYLKT